MNQGVESIYFKYVTILFTLSILLFISVKCEYCGTSGALSEFYSKNKRFCRMECSKKHAILFQKKGPGTKAQNNLNSTNNRSNKRKLSRNGPQLKKVS